MVKSAPLICLLNRLKLVNFICDESFIEIIEHFI